MEKQPFTESSNEITEDIDICDAEGIVARLQKVDAQIFTGISAEVQSMFTPKILDTIAKVTTIVRDTLVQYPGGKSAVVLGGCGTSGRLAFLISRICNNFLGDSAYDGSFYYSIAGGDKSIMVSEEAPEDDPAAGVKSLLEISKGKDKVVYIGISVGLSAPYVGGQLEYCMGHLDVFTPVLLGFNPVERARNVLIASWGKSFRTVAVEMGRLAAEGKTYVINPIIGGESITGSSRMKGGSITIIVLEAMLFMAIDSVRRGVTENLATTRIAIESVLRQYQTVCSAFYESEASKTMKEVMEVCAAALKEDATMRYLASGWTGVLGIIDSTECPPTYGATVDGVRGFIPGGYEYMGTEDFGAENYFYKLGFQDFLEYHSSSESKTKKPAVITFVQSQNDPLLPLLRGADSRNCLRAMKTSGRVLAIVMDRPNAPKIDISDLSDCFSGMYRLTLPTYDNAVFSSWDEKGKKAMEDSLYSCCMKWMLNSASTGGHVLLGKVYGNFMCDVKVTNAKLYHRAVEIVWKLCGNISWEKAKECLLKSLYDLDDLPPGKMDAPYAEHLKAAVRDLRVVPIAIVLGRLNCSLADAIEYLNARPVVRNALMEAGR